uniref:X8 domain-containing protein n=1 Tax=Salix viminalis TaxID=40686 RepID=A0A6N2M0C8_SALVM
MFHIALSFDANHDTLVWALENSIGDLKIIMGEAVWPTDGNINANPKLAKTLHDDLFKEGNPYPTRFIGCVSPLWPNRRIRRAFHGDMSIDVGDSFAMMNSQISIDLSGQGDEKMLIAAYGVQYMTSEWCVLNEENKNLAMIQLKSAMPCSLADCRRLDYGSSCNKLDFDGNVSYAFNRFLIKMKGRVISMIVKTDASRGDFHFTLQLVGAGERLKLACEMSIISGLMLAFSP